MCSGGLNRRNKGEVSTMDEYVDRNERSLTALNRSLRMPVLPSYGRHKRPVRVARTLVTSPGSGLIVHFAGGQPLSLSLEPWTHRSLGLARSGNSRAAVHVSIHRIVFRRIPSPISPDEGPKGYYLNPSAFHTQHA